MIEKHSKDPVLCWGESLGRNLFKIFCSIHGLMGEEGGPEIDTWKSAVAASPDHYTSLIVERPKEWTNYREIPSMPCSATRGYAKHNEPLFTLMSPEGLRVELLAGMPVTDLFACATQFGWTVYLSTDFLDEPSSNPIAVNSLYVWEPQEACEVNVENYQPTWEPETPWQISSSVAPEFRSGSFWPEAEVENALGMYRAGFTFEDIADHHQRSVGAISSRLSKLGCFAEGPLNEYEIDQLTECAKAAGDIDALARRLKRTPSHCRWVLREVCRIEVA